MKTSFYSWLMHQVKRDDFVGDFANDVKNDSSRPHGNSGYQTWKNFLFQRHACKEALEGFETAWQEYQLFLGNS